MEKELVFKMVQGQIGYDFKNLDLLNQAFTRRSYTEENGGENNEILEFIGDKALDFAVIKLLIAKFGRMKNGDPADGTKQTDLEKQFCQPKDLRVYDGANEFLCDYSEGELTKIKSRMVAKKNLARRMDEMGFAEYLIMGQSDINNNVMNEVSVKEDLFEAIVGAVVLDSEWDFAVIQSVVETMLLPEDFIESDSDDNYVRMIQDWEMQENHTVPLFRFKEQSYSSTWYYPFGGISQVLPCNSNTHRLKFHCELKLLNRLPIFRGFGASKSEARMNVCKLAYEYLEKNGYIRHVTMRDEIDEPTKEDAINQLEILARRGYFSIPTYEYAETHDNDGNPVWKCKCRIKEYDKVYAAESSSKKEAKKLSALKMLEYVIQEA
ncbi:MAG: putative dsRNA-binding protein [Firmicutes bacterium]|nr:putative dsRNA-binding protein [Bacillota bacterium]